MVSCLTWITNYNQTSVSQSILIEMVWNLKYIISDTLVTRYTKSIYDILTLGGVITTIEDYSIRYHYGGMTDFNLHAALFWVSLDFINQ